MITMIAAIDRNNGIGYDNKLLCKLKDDMNHFVKTTTGNTVIMGRNTFTSIGEKPLEDRVNFVCTSKPSACNFHYRELLEKESDLFFDVPFYFDSIVEENPEQEFIVIGGQTMYEYYLEKASRLYITQIHHTFEKVDTYFPSLAEDDWVIVDRMDYEKNEDNEYSFSILTLERVVPDGSKEKLL